MLENIKLAFSGVWVHKLRSLLTMLGIIIGIAAIIAIISTIAGTNNQIKQNLIGSGNNSVDVQLFDGDNAFDFSYSQMPEGVPVISEEVRQSLEELKEVEEASLYRYRPYAEGVYYLDKQLSGGSVYGIDQHYLDVYGYQIAKGRGFTELDFQQFRKVALIDEVAAKTLMQGEDCIGRTLEIAGEPFVIIGMMKETEGFEPVINTLEDYYTYHDDSVGSVYIPDAAWSMVYRYDEPQSAAVRAVDTDAMTDAGKKTADILNTYLKTENENLKYKAENLLQQAKNLQDLSAATNNQLIWIASISLLVGGIGVMNIMLVSVTERTREIGLKKALGARKSRILIQFLEEAAVLTSIGGLIGVASGVGLAYIISSITATPVAISVPAILLAFVFSMCIGVIFGLLPAFKAARMNPIEALRQE